MSKSSSSEARRAQFSALLEQVVRLDPEFRAAFASEGAGGISFGFAERDYAQVLEVLRGLPDDAGRAVVAQALAPFLGGESDEREQPGT